MKTFINVLALWVVAATSTLAQAAAPSKAHESHQQVTASPHIYWRGQDIGTDPDPNVRFELQRDVIHHGVHY